MEMQVLVVSVDKHSLLRTLTKRHDVTSQKTTVFGFCSDCRRVVLLIVQNLNQYLSKQN
jgi:hypothetical protein